MTILAIGAHFDDIELNASGMLLRARAEGHKIFLVVCTDGVKAGDPKKRMKEQEEVNKIMGYHSAFYYNLPDGYLTHTSKLVQMIEGSVKIIKPDLVITHDENDFHQDHVAVSKSVRSVNRYSRFSTICFPSQDVKQPFLANMHVNITKYFKKKLSVIKMFQSQKTRPWLSKEWIEARNVGINNFKHTEKFYIQFLKI